MVGKRRRGRGTRTFWDVLSQWTFVSRRRSSAEDIEFLVSGGELVLALQRRGHDRFTRMVGVTLQGPKSISAWLGSPSEIPSLEYRKDLEDFPIREEMGLRIAGRTERILVWYGDIATILYLIGEEDPSASTRGGRWPYLA